MSMDNSQQPPPPSTIPPPGAPSVIAPPPPLPYSSHAAPFHHLLQQQHHHQLQMFWNFQRQEIENANDFKNHQLPLARIKKIMKADEDVRMISAEAPVLFAKACELFILELTIRSWLHAEENKRRTLQKNDIAAAITRTDIFDFLVDIVPRDAVDVPKVGGADDASSASSSSGAATGIAAAAAGVPYYYPPIGQPAVVPSVDHSTAYGQPSWQPMWQPGAPDAGQGPYGGGPNLDGQGYPGGHPTQHDGS